MIAEISPQMGGAPEATAIPSENGTETIETTSPASRSCRQCFSPARPFCGFSAAIIAVSSISHHSPECRGNVRSGDRSSTPRFSQQRTSPMDRRGPLLEKDSLEHGAAYPERSAEDWSGPEFSNRQCEATGLPADCRRVQPIEGHAQ